MGSLTTYNEDEVAQKMIDNKYDSDYYKIVISVPYEDALAAIQKTFDVCDVRLDKKTLADCPSKYANNSMKILNKEKNQVKYNVYERSCFAFVDWFCGKAGISLGCVYTS